MKDVSMKERAERLAEKLGIYIPSFVEIHLWSVPILEELYHRLELIEKELEKVKKKNGE